MSFRAHRSHANSSPVVGSIVRTMVAALTLGTVAVGCGAHGTQNTSDANPDPARRGPQGRVAQFVVKCEPGHTAYDDPIVHPNDPGASHLHQFFGNVAVDSKPDYDRVAGAATTCAKDGDSAGYWAPALLDAQGNRVDPVSMTAYYRPGIGVDAADVVAYPPGLMLVAGNAHAERAQSLDVVAWSCGTGALRQTEPPACPTSSKLRLILNFPDCWDGQHLTSADPHMASTHTAYSTDGGCPADHPVAVPQLRLGIDYPPVDPTGLSLASGSILTGHADFWNVWNQAALEEEVKFCINRDLVCGVTS
jgi:hypothetical protein